MVKSFFAAGRNLVRQRWEVWKARNLVILVMSLVCDDRDWKVVLVEGSKIDLR